MSLKKNSAYFVINFSRALVFYILLFFPVILLGNFFLHKFPYTISDFSTNPWSYIVSSAYVFTFIWSVYFALNLVLPVLFILLFKLERERSPKKIIQFGDRFRRVGLSVPQVFILKEKNPLLSFWTNNVYGYFGLPSPVGALLLLSPNVNALTEIELDQFVCPKVIESRFAKLSVPLLIIPSLFIPFSLMGFGIATHYFNTNMVFTLLLALPFIIFALIISFLFIKSRNRFLLHKYHSIFASGDEIKQELEISGVFIRKKLFAPRLVYSLPAICFILASYILMPSITVTTFDKLVATISSRLEPKPKISIAVSTASVAKENQFSDLSLAVKAGDMRKIIQLIGAGKNIRDRDPALNGATPLLLSLKNGDIELAYLLMALGSSLSNEIDLSGKGALFYALESPTRTRTVAYVLSGRIDLNQKSIDGMTAYDYAVKNGWSDVIDMFNKRGVASSSSQAIMSMIQKQDGLDSSSNPSVNNNKSTTNTK
jgi:hypothetical protein